MTNSKLKAGSIILVKFPFTDLENSKQRPCLVLHQVSYSKNLKLNTVAMMTSQIDSPLIAGDVDIQEWKNAGLLHPSRVRLAKIATLEDQLIVKNLGLLSNDDFKKIKIEFKKLFKSFL